MQGTVFQDPDRCWLALLPFIESQLADTAPHERAGILERARALIASVAASPPQLDDLQRVANRDERVGTIVQNAVHAATAQNPAWILDGSTRSSAPCAELAGKPPDTPTEKGYIKSMTTIEKRGMWGSPGGKYYLAPRLLPLIPDHRVYCEAFAGGGQLLLMKEPSPVEVLNDLDEEIAAGFQFVKSMTDEHISRLRRKSWQASRAQFERLLRSRPSNDIDRFHRFVYLARFSFDNKRDTYAPSETGVKTNILDRAIKFRERLKNVRVHASDYEQIIHKYDGKDTFFFLDPPYKGYDAFPIVGHRHKGWDEERFAKVLQSIKGKFLCTYGLRGDRALFKGFHISRIRHTGRGYTDGMRKISSLLVSNYALPTRKRASRDDDRWPRDMNRPLPGRQDADSYDPSLDWSADPE